MELTPTYRKKVIFTFGGLPHYYNYVLNRLQKEGNIDLKVVLPQKGSRTIGKGVFQTQKDVEFGLLPLIEKKAWYGKSYFVGLEKMIEEERPDILVTVWPFVLSFIFDRKLLRTIRKYNVKLIFKDIPFNIPNYHEAVDFFTSSIRLEDLSKPKSGLFWKAYYTIFRELTKRYLKLMDAHVYYASKAYEIIGSYGIAEEKIFIIYNSPDTDRLFEKKRALLQTKPILTLNPHRILHVGRLVAWKKVDQLIEAFTLIKRKIPNSELVILGNGPELEHLKSKVQILGVDNVIFIDGTYDSETLGKYFIESTVYVLAGMGGLSINEAMVYGKPVICSVADGTENELVRSGFNGYIFEEDNVQDLADKIEELISDPNRVQEFGKNSLKIIEEEININTVINGYLKAFDYVLS